VDDPELLLWVHCGEVASVADIARRSGLPFTAADLDAFVDEQRTSAELIGVDRAAAPASMAELDAYYERIRPGLYACEEAKQTLRLTFHPPVPDGNRAEAGLPPVAALAFYTLPRWARRMYGRPSGLVSDMTATGGLRAAGGPGGVRPGAAVPRGHARDIPRRDRRRRPAVRRCSRT